jgi:hypothetical protein
LKLEGDTSLDVAASLTPSVRELRQTRPDIADRWHELAVFPASSDSVAAAAIWDQSMAAARDALGTLLSRSIVLYDETQQRWRQGLALHHLGNRYAALGERYRAIELLRGALTIYEAIESPEASPVRAKIEALAKGTDHRRGD